ncbi:ankyrin repeat-containing domain protein, partial [Lentinula guzmanii]
MLRVVEGLRMLWFVIEKCGAIPELEDKEGESGIHKASLNGHLPIIQYLLTYAHVDPNTQDGDGWSALHNACSKGYLDIVQYLSDTNININIQNKTGYTPLMTASSKGHLPIVNYLLNTHSADPLMRNNYGETAYDLAAAVFEVGICEVLVEAEKRRFGEGDKLGEAGLGKGLGKKGKGGLGKGRYNPLEVHTTVPVVVLEIQVQRKGEAQSQQLQTRFELCLGDETVELSSRDVDLPWLDDPFTFPFLSPQSQSQSQKPQSQSQSHSPKSHFWLSDWTLDMTHPNIDLSTGWEYAPAPDQTPTQTSTRTATRTGTQTRTRTRTVNWTRRRRWVRLVRRRLDIDPLPFLFPDGGIMLLRGLNGGGLGVG